VYIYYYHVKVSFLKLCKSGAWGDSPINAPRRGWVAGVSPRYDFDMKEIMTEYLCSLVFYKDFINKIISR
jgi:hypothetical protein